MAEKATIIKRTKIALLTREKQPWNTLNCLTDFFIMITLVCIILSSCVTTSIFVKEIDHPEASVRSFAPTKAHLYDGSLIVFADGFVVKGNLITGQGLRYNLTRLSSHPVNHILIDSIACLEYYESRAHPGTIFGHVLGPVLFTAAVTNDDIAKAIFGSCPTIYSYDGDNYTLQAECFSYSIASRFESDDLDRIDYGEIINNKYILKVKNEALETHYINRMQLLCVEHPEKYEAFPTDKHAIILFGKEQPLVSGIDKAGRNITELIASRDSLCYKTDPQIAQKLAKKVIKDWVEVAVDIPDGAEKMYIALRLRNTLFNTVLLYDVMLQANGIQALNWLSNKTNDLMYAWSLHRWYKKHFGMKIQVWNGEEFKTKIRIGDAGPIAWRQVATELSVPKGKTALLRFVFLPDNWMIDWIGVSFDSSFDFKVHEIDCSQIQDISGYRTAIPPSLVKDKDEEYLITYPAETYLLTFEINDMQEQRQRSYFLKSRGFYIEWIRHNWLVSSPETNKIQFKLDDQTLVETAQLWLKKKEHFEKQFFDSKISRESWRIQ